MIAIKGMTMPKTCYDCPLLQDGWVDRFCGITWMPLRYPEYREKRDKTCPLVPCIGIIRGYKEHKPKLFDFDDEVEE